MGREPSNREYNYCKLLKVLRESALLEAIPQLEEELNALVIRFVDNAVKARAPAMAKSSRHRLFEGHKSTIVRPGGEEEDIELREFSAESVMPKTTILYASIAEILQCFIPIAESMATDHEKMFFDVMEQVTEKTGNIVDGGGQPLSFEGILKAFEAIQIDFDSHGNPRMPTMMIGAALGPRIKELVNDPAVKDFEKKQEEIINKKRLEWRDREANRTLVG